MWLPHQAGWPAFGTAQEARPIDDGHPGAMLRNLAGNIGLGLAIAALAPHDQTDMGGERLAQG
jgi:hypothetical protein